MRPDIKGFFKKPAEVKIDIIKQKFSNKRFVTGVFIALLIIAVIFFYVKDYSKHNKVYKFTEGPAVSISLDSGYYTDSVEVSLEKNLGIPSGAKIYYSLDGTDPEKSKANRYTEPIKLEKTEDDYRIYVLKAAVYYMDNFSGSVSRTYIIGSSHPDFEIISITADEYSLYDYEYGIFVPGKVYDKNNTGRNKASKYGNYSERGEEWIRDAQFTMFDKSGNVIVDADVGIGVAGGTSSSFERKSLRIVRSEDANTGIKLDLNLDSVSDFTLDNEHKNFRLRSGSQDMSAGNLRSAVASRLVSQTGFDGIVNTRRALVILNNNVYGVFDIQENYSDSMLKKRFSLPDSDNIETYESAERLLFLYKGFVECFDEDLNIAENREKLEEFADMDNYLEYYAAEILINNSDWPDNNFKMWRYSGGYDGKNPYTDGRYRFLIFDVDISYYTEGNNEYFDGAFEDTFTALMEGKYRGTSSRFPMVMKSEYYRQRFLTILSDMLAGAFNKDNVLSVIDEEQEKVRGMYDRYFSKEENEKQIYFYQLMRQAAEQRDTDIREDVKKYLGSQSTYTVQIICDEGSCVSWFNQKVYGGETRTTDYFDGAVFTVNAAVCSGYEFKALKINGEEVDGTSAEISAELAREGVITVETVSEKKNGACLVIGEISSDSDNDWIKIENIGNEAVSLAGMYITDSEKDMTHYGLPRITLGAGESLTVYCESNYHALNEYICNFNLGNGETLYLYNSDTREIEDSVFVKRMGSNETYKRLPGCDTFRFVKIKEGP